MKYIKYREDKKHGTFDFPIEFYHVTASHPQMCIRDRPCPDLQSPQRVVFPIASYFSHLFPPHPQID